MHPLDRARRYVAKRDQYRVAVKIRAARHNGAPVVLTRAEALARFDRLAQQELGISGREFLRRLESGELPDSPAIAHLTALAGGSRTS